MLTLTAGSAFAQSGGNVEIVVENGLFHTGQITSSLNRYMRDIRLQGYNPILTTTAFGSAEALKTHLVDRYNNDGLEGAVLIGDMPSVNYELIDGDSRDTFACDYFFQDLNGTWDDQDGNGDYDYHSGLVRPEIWMGRMMTHNLVNLQGGRSEASLLNDYFDKNHAYRYKKLTLPDRGLAYIDDDWAYSDWHNDLAMAVTGPVTHVNDLDTTNAEDYKTRLTEGYEHVLVAAHACSQYQSFRAGPDGNGGRIYNHELEDLNPQVFFYNLFSCSNANYVNDGYMAGEYVFGTDMGLLSVGSTKAGAMLKFDDYFQPLGNGETFGDAWKDWWYDRGFLGFSNYEKEWHFGMTMIGDPLLHTQAYVQERLETSVRTEKNEGCVIPGCKTFDIIVSTDEWVDWTNARLSLSLHNGQIYQDPDGDSDAPQSDQWASDPDLEWDSFAAAPQFEVPLWAVMSGDGWTDTTAEIGWFDLEFTEHGEFVAVRLTVTEDAVGTFLLSVFDSESEGEALLYSGVIAEIGDADLDNDVDATDLATLGMAWDPIASDATWQDGDFDGDGDVDATDLAALGMNWNPVGFGAPIPEPTSLGLLALGGVLWIKRRQVKI